MLLFYTGYPERAGGSQPVLPHRLACNCPFALAQLTVPTRAQKVGLFCMMALQISQQHSGHPTSPVPGHAFPALLCPPAPCLHQLNHADQDQEAARSHGSNAWGGPCLIQSVWSGGWTGNLIPSDPNNTSHLLNADPMPAPYNSVSFPIFNPYIIGETATFILQLRRCRNRGSKG